jgi:hypothetical protein
MKTKKEIGYAFVFILAAAVFTSTVLLYYSFLLQQFLPPSNLAREYAICFGQLFFQGILLYILKTKPALTINYLKNMMMVSLLGALLLIPLLFVAHYIPIAPLICLAYFFAVVFFMFFNHKKRVEDIAAPWWLSYSWVLYRCLVLLIIL